MGRHKDMEFDPVMNDFRDDLNRLVDDLERKLAKMESADEVKVNEVRASLPWYRRGILGLLRKYLMGGKQEQTVYQKLATFGDYLQDRRDMNSIVDEILGEAARDGVLATLIREFSDNVKRLMTRYMRRLQRYKPERTWDSANG